MNNKIKNSAIKNKTRSKKEETNEKIKNFKIDNLKNIINKVVKKKTNQKKIKLFFIFYTTLLFLEILFRICCTESIFKFSLIYLILYLIPVSIILSIISSLFNKKINRIILITLLFLITILYGTYIVFTLKFGVFFSIETLTLSNQLNAFIGDTIKTILKHSIKIIIMFMPIIIVIINKNKIKFIEKRHLIRSLLLFIISIVIFYLSLLITNFKDYSVYKLCFKKNNNSLLLEKTGVSLASLTEIKKMIFNYGEEDIIINIPKQEKKTKEKNKKIKYNTLNIDFDSLSANTTDNTLLTMNEYFKNDLGTKQNKYTGMYEGKNLILFMAESFNSVAVSKELTPTLYKLTQEGFVFENFYSPVILSTIGGEFQELTGLYPHISLLSNVWRKGINYYEYGLGNVFNNKNYLVNAYHNNQYNFQNRNDYLKSVGFQNYTGCKNGLETKINCSIWPESDVEMIEATVGDFINSPTPFMTYYVTVSGHMSYNWGNAMSKKHKEEVASLNYPENVKAYIATQIELDKALEILLNKLKESGKLDDTVIALVGDHYPYDLPISDINKASSYERDSVIEINHSNFILWNPKTETTKITKVGSQIDVLPTLLNLFNVKFDSRLIIGKDILSDNEGLAIFNNNSWVSDKGKYYASTNTFIPNDPNFIESSEYVSNTNSLVNNRVNMSKYILEKNYYKYVFKNNE